MRGLTILIRRSGNRYTSGPPGIGDSAERLNSLWTFPDIRNHDVACPVPGRRQEHVRVIKTEEKGSDVNLAAHLVHDAHMGRLEVAVIVSNAIPHAAIETSEISNRRSQNCHNRMISNPHDLVYFRPRHQAGHIYRLGCCIFSEAMGGVASPQPALGLGRGNSLPIPCRTPWQGKCFPCSRCRRFGTTN